MMSNERPPGTLLVRKPRFYSIVITLNKHTSFFKITDLGGEKFRQQNAHLQSSEQSNKIFFEM